MELDRFRETFSFEAWFDSWRKTLEAPASAGHVWPPSTRRTVLEALSDIGAEQVLNSLVAMHLRRYGSEFAQTLAKTLGATQERLFWVRSDWRQVDLSYGLANPFRPTLRSWNMAWSEGATGDLGQCEMTVCYAHHHDGKVRSLAERMRNQQAYGLIHEARGLAQLRHHGMIWLFEHGGAEELEKVGARLLAEAEEQGLVVRRPFEYPKTADDLGMLWPSRDGSPYRCGMAVALVEWTGAPATR